MSRLAQRRHEPLFRSRPSSIACRVLRVRHSGRHADAPMPPPPALLGLAATRATASTQLESRRRRPRASAPSRERDVAPATPVASSRPRRSSVACTAACAIAAATPICRRPPSRARPCALLPLVSPRHITRLTREPTPTTASEPTPEAKRRMPDYRCPGTRSATSIASLANTAPARNAVFRSRTRLHGNVRMLRLWCCRARSVQFCGSA